MPTTLWAAVQAALTAGGRARSPSLPAGLIFDGAGNVMTPTHAVKQGKRYRYYVSSPLITGGPCNQSKLCRLPAPELERVVTERIQALLTDPASLSDAIGSTTVAADIQHRLIDDAATLAGSWPSLPHIRQREILTRLVSRIKVAASRI